MHSCKAMILAVALGDVPAHRTVQTLSARFKDWQEEYFRFEHILAENDANYALFNYDKEQFDRERNKLGGLLLLKGRDNISSNNETYDNKLKTYANTLYWNETLRDDWYKSKLDFAEFKDKYNLNFRAMNIFGPSELEERHQLLFNISKIIWG